MKAIAFGCVVLLGLFFGLGVFISARRSPLWVRWSSLFCGLLAVASGVLGYYLERYRPSLPFRTRSYLDHYGTLLGGIAIGVFAVLVISGQIRLMLQNRNEV
jgi:hypothetical protein